MSSPAGLKQLRSRVEPPVAKLDEAVWQAWLAKGRLRARRNFALRMQAVKWVSVAILLAAAGFWSYLAPYEVVVRFFVAGGAAVVMFQAFYARRYALAAVFAGLVLLYNPIVQEFSLSGGWQRSLVLVSVIPFIVALTWRNERLKDND